jgi:RNA polymerase sigma-70 factor (ECF subfamily)
MSNEVTNLIEAEGFSLEALRAGDRVEFSRVVEAYYTNIYRLAMKMLGNQQDAEDVLQETFLKAYRHLNGFDGRSKLSTWLFRIATNEALMMLRRQRPDVVSIDEPIETEDGEFDGVQIIDWCCMPEKELMSSEARQNLDIAIDKLPYNLKIVVVLRDIENMSTQETAEVLGLSETAVKTRLSRARLRLREDLSVYFGSQASKSSKAGAVEM